MNNSSRPIRSPINLGRKAKWVDGAGEGSPGGKTKSGISEAVEFNVAARRAREWLGCCRA